MTSALAQIDHFQRRSEYANVQLLEKIRIELQSWCNKCNQVNVHVYMTKQLHRRHNY